MNICIVRPPTFVSETTYPLNIEYVESVLTKDYNVTFFDAELLAMRKLKYKMKSGRLHAIGNILFPRDVEEKQQKIVQSFFKDQKKELWKEIANEIISKKPKIIAFSCYSASMSSTIEILKCIKEMYKSKYTVIVGGIHPTAAYEEVLKKVPEIDYVVIGEGEITIKELVDYISKKVSKKISSIKGIAYRNKEKIMINNPREPIKDLDSFPEIKFKYIADYKNYVIITSRGCPFQCKFCASKVLWGRKVRFRSAEKVVSEIAYLRKKKNIKFIRIGDDTFTLSIKHIKAIKNELDRVKINDVHFSIGSRIDTINDEKLKILKEMNVYNISFGIETGSSKIMKSIGKGINVKDVIPTIKKVNKMGISTVTYFIVNHPNEDLKDIKATEYLIKRLNKNCPLNIAYINTAFPYHGTEWWDWAESKGLVSNIDIYTKSHEYNHQAKPAINMTNLSDKKLIECIRRIEKTNQMHSLFVYIRKGIKIFLKDPKRILNMIR